MIDGEFAALDSGEDPPAGAAAEIAEMGTQEPGQRRRGGYPAPFADRAGFQVPVVADLAVIGPLGARLGRG